MIINTELSAAARAGALDASLAFTTLHNETRDLVNMTAIAGLQGLQSLLSDTGIYKAAIDSLQEATDSIELANAEAAKDPFKAANATQSTQQLTAVSGGLKTQAGPYKTEAANVYALAETARNETGTGTTERNIAETLKGGADKLILATNKLVNDGNVAQGRQLALEAYADAQSARAQAQAHLIALNAMHPLPTERIADTQRVLSAANSVIAASENTKALTESPIGVICQEVPVVHDLGNGQTLATWGDSGYWTLVDASGKGIIVSPDGTVDPLDGAGQGWKFQNTSTFILPGDTKITVNPGNPANLLISRGIHAFTIGDLKSGSNPTASDYDTLNGRVEDRASNDGHLLRMDGNASAWKLNGQVLGDAASREVVATIAVTQEEKLDPTDVAVSATLLSFIQTLGLTATDYDGDGKLNNEELATLAVYVGKYVEQLQAAYNEALGRISEANEALFQLNTMLDELSRQGANHLDERAAENAESRAALQAIEKRLVAALQLLRGDGATQPTGSLSGGIESNAERVLGQLTQITQGGGVQNATFTPPPQQPTNPPLETLGQSQNGSGQPTDPLGDSLRRASRLLGGLGNLNILDLPPTPPANNPAAAPLPAGLGDLASALQVLSGVLGEGAPPLDQKSLQIGLESLFTTLGELGIVDLAALQGAQGLTGLLEGLTGLLGGSLGQGTQATAEAAAVLGFLGALASLGASPSATGRQLDQVLAGLAALGSAGAGQSSNANPTPAELRLGLQSFLAALAAFGIFGAQQQSQPTQQSQNLLSNSNNNTTGITFQAGGSPDGNRAQIATITGNFYTDPEVMKQLKANLNKTLQVQAQQLARATVLFTMSQELVQHFVSILKTDDLIRDIVKSDELSDEQQQVFAEKMSDLRKDWGMEWGSDDNKTPAGQSQLVSKVMQSGMMV